MAQQNKEHQKKLLTEIMEADQKNGLYDIPNDVWSRKFEYLKKVNESIKHKSQDERIWIFGASDLGFTAGYNQALEDNKERKYTEEDMLNAHLHGWIYRGESSQYSKARNLFKQSLQPQTEWEVEIVDGKLKLKQ